MLVRAARGDIPTVNTLFKNDSNNKMIDVINNERFTIVAQKRFNIVDQGSLGANGVITLTGEPIVQGSNNTSGIGSRVVNMWVPGRKLGKYGNLQFENGSNGQLKFFDYYVCMLVYDWYGSPESSLVGAINELYTKVYFKDA
jgi:hypothetical protein